MWNPQVEKHTLEGWCWDRGSCHPHSYPRWGQDAAQTVQLLRMKRANDIPSSRTSQQPVEYYPVLLYQPF